MSIGSRLVSVVLPVHDQADHIATVIHDYEAVLTRGELAYELVLVANACTDRSVAVCRALAEHDPALRVVESKRGGWGHAVRLGLQASHGDLLCYANSARTSAADLLLLLLYGVANPEAVVKPHRRSRDSLTRKLGSFFYNAEVRVLFDLPTWDVNATPKVFHRDLYEQIDIRSDGDLIDLEFYLSCKKLNRTILEVPIYSWHRFGGNSTTTYRSALNMYLGAYRMWRRVRHESAPTAA